MNRPAVDPMELFRVSEFNPDYRQTFEDADIMNFEIWTADREYVGKVQDILMDDIGQLYYIVANIRSWLNRKLVLIEPEQFRIDRAARRISLVNLSKETVNHLPAYDATLLNRASAPSTQASSLQLPVESSTPLEASAALDSTPLIKVDRPQPIIAPPASDRAIDPPDPIAPPMVEQETVRLLEERLIVNRLKRKIGEVVVRKEIETRIVQIPLRREKLIIEQISPDWKHLATVDLPSQLSDAELTNFAQTALDSIESSRFVSAEVAQQTLADLSQRNGDRAARVRLIFEDEVLQAEYDRQLAQTHDL
jgi:stress response protein YsnF